MTTKISWADATWNPIIGCSKISAGCANCYAERMAFRLGSMERHKWTYGRVVNHCGDHEFRIQWNGSTEFIESALTKPLHWRKPRKIFVCSMSDLFHESVPFEWIDRVFAVMALCPQHQFMCLTKRAGRMREYCGDLLARTPGMDKAARELGIPHNEVMYPGGLKTGVYQFSLPLPNVHLGVTVENQDNVGRIADLIRTSAAKRFLSLEPLLCGFDIDLTGIDYIYVGCESGSGARLCKGHAIRHMIRQGQAADVQVHVKQIPLNGKCNKNFDEWPEEFQVREI